MDSIFNLVSLGAANEPQLSAFAGADPYTLDDKLMEAKDGDVLEGDTDDDIRFPEESFIASTDTGSIAPADFGNDSSGGNQNSTPQTFEIHLANGEEVFIGDDDAVARSPGGSSRLYRSFSSLKFTSPSDGIEGNVWEDFPPKPWPGFRFYCSRQPDISFHQDFAVDWFQSGG